MRHLQGIRGHRIENEKLDEDIGIKRVIQRWSHSVNKLSWPDSADATAHLNISFYAPSYWTTLPDWASSNFCITTILEIKSTIHGKQHQALPSNINAAIQHRETLSFLERM